MIQLYGGDERAGETMYTQPKKGDNMFAKMLCFYLCLWGVLFMIVFMLVGCAAGVSDLGSHTFSNGLTIHYLQATTEGHDKPQITVMQAFVETSDGVVNRIGEWAAQGKSIAGDLATAAIGAGGQVGSAYLFGASIRPDKYVNNETQNLNNTQEQEQGQQQKQTSQSYSEAINSNKNFSNSNSTNTNVNANTNNNKNHNHNSNKVTVRNRFDGGPESEDGGGHPGCKNSNHC